jgi:hypothetical protein
MKTLYGGARTKRTAEAVGSVVVLLTTLLGGGFAPVEWYAEGMRSVAAASPVGCASKVMLDALLHDKGVAANAPHVAGMYLWAAGLIVVGFFLSWRSHARN